MVLVCCLLGAGLAVQNASAGAVTPTTGWNLHSSAISPPALQGAAVAYDPATGDVVLFGGTGPGGVSDDTWIWDGSNWIQQFPADAPPAVADASMAYDPTTQTVVLFGGVDPTTNAYYGDTWSWDGTDWTRLSPATSPPVRAETTMAYDAATGDIVLFGGSTGPSSPMNDTWTWDGTNWTEQSPATSPGARYGAVMDYDAATGSVVLFGGDGLAALDDTWTWDGTNWTEQSPAASPPESVGSTMAYDPATHQDILFGGYDAGTASALNGTWLWNGLTWAQQGATTTPAARYDASMAYDGAQGDIVLFGGEAGSVLDDTWTYDSTTLYVTPTGAGSVCTFTSPCGSIENAVSAATGGSYALDNVTIDVAAGTYENEVDTIDAATLGSLTIAGAGAGSTIASGSGLSPVFTVTGGTVEMTGLTIENGLGATYGGGISNSATLLVSGCTLSGNRSGDYGGGISNSGFLTVDASTITGNTADDGGGGIYNSGVAYLGDDTVSDNNATDLGAGIYSTLGLTIHATTISGNTASGSAEPLGGGVVVGAGSMSLNDSTVADNTGGFFAGGIFLGHGTSAAIISTTIAGNSATTGGGLYNDGSTLDLGATIIAGQPSGGDCYSSVALTDLGDNLDDDGSCGLTGGGDLSDTPAGLDPSGLADNGGPTQTIALQVGSAAVGAATSGLCTFTPADQRGVPNPTTCNIGSYDAANSPGPFTDVVVSGFSTYDGGPTFTDTAYSPPGVTVSGTLNCTTADSGTGFGQLGLGGHTVDGQSCSGLTSSDPSDPVFYQGATNGFLVLPDSTFTTVTPSADSQRDGNESATTFTVTVTTGNGEELPATDSANVFVGSTNCVATITPDPGGGSGGCSIGNSALGAGTYGVMAAYGGDTDLVGSDSPSTSFTVTPAATIGGVTIEGTPAAPTITVSGSAFGTISDLGTPTAACGGTGSDYGDSFYFMDGFGAGQGPGDCIGVLISSYTANQIVFTFGSGYGNPSFGALIKDGDSFSMTVLGATFNGTVSVGTRFTCTVSGGGGTANFPVVLSESPAPPVSVDKGGTFSTVLAAQVTVPASVVNYFIAQGASRLTVNAQTVTEDGRTSVGGPLSGAVNPDTESATADDLPRTDPTLVAGTPYTYDTTYNPVTWQTGPGTGKVYLTPGDIDAEVTYVTDNIPVTDSVSCTPPTGVAALGSTTVDPPPATPTYQVPSSTPALENQVSAGTDGGWEATIANTSRAPVTGLSATVHVTDGLATPVTFDLAAMSASGTTCSGSGSGSVTCPVGTLAAGASDVLDLLVDTSGLLNGTTISGTASVISGNAGHASSSLGSIGVVVVEAGNGVKAVAAPGIPLVSTKKPLRTARAKVTLTLPKKKSKKGKAVAEGSASAGITPLGIPFASASVIGNQPPVAVTLESLPSSAEPALCPPTGSTRCQGDIVEAYGNFAAYTSNLTPITAEVQFFYGNTIPSGTVYFLKPNGKTVDKLALCKKTSKGYDTPCLAGAEQHLGTTGNRYAQDTVYFTGNDPVMGRR